MSWPYISIAPVRPLLQLSLNNTMTVRAASVGSADIMSMAQKGSIPMNINKKLLQIAQPQGMKFQAQWQLW